MNRLILIGNGFDLAHGLKTSYHDFILDYLKKSIQTALMIERKYIDNKTFYDVYYNDELISISANSKPYKSFMDSFKKKDQIAEIVLELRENNINITYNGDFIKSLFNECITKNWVDIEGIYYEELKKCLIQYNKSNGYDGRIDGAIRMLKHLNNQLNFLKEKLEKYLSNVIENNNPKINQIVDILHDNLPKRYLAKNAKYPNHILDKQSEKVLFLNFNYTEISKKYKNHILDDIINIHGELHKNDNPIIFGYGDEVDKHYNEIEDLNENEFFKHIKSFDYFKTSNYSKLLRFIESEDFEVFVMGHSCGLSDRTMLNTIFVHQHCKSIKIFYNPNDAVNDYRNKTYEISRHFNNKASMREKIVPFPECSPMPQHNG
ncbi:MAG: AbiH family protein [Chitinophagales bacterium]